MENVLDTINHTTLEALGFKHSAYAVHSVQQSPQLNWTDGFVLGPMRVLFHSNGAVSMSLHDEPVQLTLDDIKAIASTFKPKY